MDTVDRNKYITFKRDDLISLLRDVTPGPHTVTAVLDEALADAVVIRRQDTFAASALFAYSNAVLSAVEIMQDHGWEDTASLDHLRGLADWFAGQAEQAKMAQGKLPD